MTVATHLPTHPQPSQIGTAQLLDPAMISPSPSCFSLELEGFWEFLTPGLTLSKSPHHLDLHSNAGLPGLQTLVLEGYGCILLQSQHSGSCGEKIPGSQAIDLTLSESNKKANKHKQNLGSITRCMILGNFVGISVSLFHL